jgi:dUTP pyrophosphatase
MFPEIYLMFVDKQAASGDITAQEQLFPKKSSLLAAGFDLVAANTSPITFSPMQRALVPTGISIALPPHFEAQIRPRSGLALKNGVTVLNSPGTIDADYRGEIKVILINLGESNFIVERGMRIAQMVIASVPNCTLTPSLSLNETARADKGFGSTGITC